jgi:protoporphyrinogen oxidase
MFEVRERAAGTIILGAGMTGLGAASSSGLPVYEAAARPGGVCHSYYVSENRERLDPRVEDASECFRVEPAGGHWLFGASQVSLERLARFCRFRKHTRKAGAFFAREGLLVPYPVQENLRYLPPEQRRRILAEIDASAASAGAGAPSFKEWLLEQFGPSLCEAFFFPFNERYTCGLLSEIAPQDPYKSAMDRERALRGAVGPIPTAGYNDVFHYPDGGLDGLVREIAASCTIHLDHRAVGIDTRRRVVEFTNGARTPYEGIISTIPLDRMLRLCGIRCAERPDPATAVLVLNVGATRGARCPSDHWVYIPTSTSGLHRVGIYSNVDRTFLPARHRDREDVVSLYAERSFPACAPPRPEEVDRAAHAIVSELKEWAFIEHAIVVDATFTDPAYTWSWRGSRWAQEAVSRLAERGIRQIGRYGAWRFQGMVASFEEGLSAGRAAVAVDGVVSQHR